MFPMSREPWRGQGIVALRRETRRRMMGLCMAIHPRRARSSAEEKWSGASRPLGLA